MITKIEEWFSPYRTKRELIEILVHVEAQRAEAWEEFMRLIPIKEEVYTLRRFMGFPLTNKNWKAFINQMPREIGRDYGLDLCYLIWMLNFIENQLLIRLRRWGITYQEFKKINDQVRRVRQEIRSCLA